MNKSGFKYSQPYNDQPNEPYVSNFGQQGYASSQSRGHFNPDHQDNFPPGPSSPQIISTNSGYRYSTQPGSYIPPENEQHRYPLSQPRGYSNSNYRGNFPSEPSGPQNKSTVSDYRFSTRPSSYIPPENEQEYIPPQEREYTKSQQQRNFPHTDSGYRFSTHHSGYIPQENEQGYTPQPPYTISQSYQPPSFQQQPIVMQPRSMDPRSQQAGGDWMNIPQAIPNCPPGLEYLSMIDQLLVHQKVELLEVFTGFETNNKFTIKNSIGQKVYYAVEDNDCCTRNCCGPIRPFDMNILDNYANEVIHLYRPLACNSCCYPCCLQSMLVSSPPGNIIGSIEQKWSILTPLFVIKNAEGNVVLRIKGPICRIEMCGDIDFHVLTVDGESVGKISKQWSGLLREMFTDSDYFGVTFPIDLDVKIKALLLGALFLIDVMYFERGRKRN